MEEAQRFRLADPDEMAPGSPFQLSDFVRASSYDAERGLRMRSLALLMQKDIELAKANASLETMRVQMQAFQSKLEAVSAPVDWARNSIAPIRRGNNLTQDQIWSACESLDIAVDELDAIKEFCAKISTKDSAEK